MMNALLRCSPKASHAREAPRKKQKCSSKELNHIPIESFFSNNVKRAVKDSYKKTSKQMSPESFLVQCDGCADFVSINLHSSVLLWLAISRITTFHSSMDGSDFSCAIYKYSSKCKTAFLLGHVLFVSNAVGAPGNLYKSPGGNSYMYAAIYDYNSAAAGTVLK
ncbi:hypothetical protein KSP40_PGU020759 [Platanthera guangdongensis]|uniref:Uncharacterized protein n=1 Tax=Platanthera guangdongensis TaxID=2320717 RepID=A0ABR2MKP5_9ASPA